MSAEGLGQAEEGRQGAGNRGVVRSPNVPPQLKDARTASVVLNRVGAAGAAESTAQKLLEAPSRAPAIHEKAGLSGLNPRGGSRSKMAEESRRAFEPVPGENI